MKNGSQKAAVFCACLSHRQKNAPQSGAFHHQFSNQVRLVTVNCQLGVGDGQVIQSNRTDRGSADLDSTDGHIHGDVVDVDAQNVCLGCWAKAAAFVYIYVSHCEHASQALVTFKELTTHDHHVTDTNAEEFNVEVHVYNVERNVQLQLVSRGINTNVQLGQVTMAAQVGNQSSALATVSSNQLH